MKTLKTIILLSSVVILAACNESIKNPELTGVYVNKTIGEYSEVSDTIIITAVSLADKTYQIENRSGFQKIRNGVKQQMEYKQDKWNATWNTDKQVLAETDLGRQILISKDKPGILMKSTLFLKIK